MNAKKDDFNCGEVRREEIEKRKKRKRKKRKNDLQFWAIILSVALLTTMITPGLLMGSVNASEVHEDTEDESLELQLQSQSESLGEQPQCQSESQGEQPQSQFESKEGDSDDSTSLENDITTENQQIGFSNFSETMDEDDLSTIEQPSEFAITFYDWDRTVLNKKTLEEGDSFDLSTITKPMRHGYDFVAWTKACTGEMVVGELLVMGEGGLIAKYEPQVYTITYNLGPNATNHPQNPTTYTIEDTPIHFKSPTSSNPIVFFTGWAEGLTIPVDATGNKTLNANWYTANGGANNLVDGKNVITIVKAEKNSQGGFAIIVKDTEGYVIDFKTFELTPGTETLTVNVGGYVITVCYQGNQLNTRMTEIVSVPVRYEPGHWGDWEPEWFSLSIGTATPNPTVDYKKSRDPSWVFDGWFPEISPFVTEGITYTAHWVYVGINHQHEVIFEAHSEEGEFLDTLAHGMYCNGTVLSESDIPNLPLRIGNYYLIDEENPWSENPIGHIVWADITFIAKYEYRGGYFRFYPPPVYPDDPEDPDESENPVVPTSPDKPKPPVNPKKPMNPVEPEEPVVQLPPTDPSAPTIIDSKIGADSRVFASPRTGEELTIEYERAMRWAIVSLILVILTGMTAKIFKNPCKSKKNML